jgi:hypothetical protein
MTRKSGKADTENYSPDHAKYVIRYEQKDKKNTHTKRNKEGDFYYWSN